MEWNGGMIEYAHDSWLKSPSYCKPCKRPFGHPSRGGKGGGERIKEEVFIKGLVAYISAL